MPKKKAKPKQEEPIEKQLWKAADKLRKNIDAAEYKHIVLGLIFLKYISDALRNSKRNSKGQALHFKRNSKETQRVRTQRVRPYISHLVRCKA